MTSVNYSSNLPDQNLTQRRAFTEERPYEGAPDKALPYHIDPISRDTDAGGSTKANTSLLDGSVENPELVTENPSYIRYMNALGESETHSRMLEGMGDWGREEIQSRDTMMEDGDLPYIPHHRTYFAYNGPDEYNLNYWENENDITQTYNPFHTPALGMIEDLMSFHQEHIQEFNDWRQTNLSGEINGHFDDQFEEVVMYGEENSRSDGTYMYWRPEHGQRTVQNHPANEELIQELIEQERLEEDEDGEIGPAEDEEATYEAIFGDETQDLYGWATNRNLMDTYQGELEEIHSEMRNAREEFFKTFGLGGWNGEAPDYIPTEAELQPTGNESEFESEDDEEDIIQLE